MVMSLEERRGTFAVEHGRPPTADELQALAEAERADRRKADGDRRESEIKRAYLEVPGSTPETWTRDRERLLAEDRAQEAKRNTDRARISQAETYRRF